MPQVDQEAVTETARILIDIAATLHDSADDFTDERYYPPRGADAETVTSYFLVMVAMDHRLSRPGHPYEAVIEGELLHGADLLYRLGALKLREDPGFFTAESLAETTTRDVMKWLCVEEVCPPDPERRAALLRDLGVKLKTLYGGEAYRVVQASNNILNGAPEAPGLVQLLGVFYAYNDPVWKKTMLLAKFLERRGIVRIKDTESKRVPVDNHVARIAYRIGIIGVEEEFKPLLEWRRQATPGEDTLLRTAVREAWHQVAVRAGIDDYILDDNLWSFGRKICTPINPRCSSCRNHNLCRKGECIFKPICRYPGLREHLYLDTWWY